MIVLTNCASGFTTTTTSCSSIHIRSNVILSAQQQQPHKSDEWTKFVASTILLSTLVLGSSTMMPALADEYGVETEAPTLFTGESVMVGLYIYIYVLNRIQHLTFP